MIITMDMDTLGYFIYMDEMERATAQQEDDEEQRKERESHTLKNVLCQARFLSRKGEDSRFVCGSALAFARFASHRTRNRESSPCARTLNQASALMLLPWCSCTRG